MLRRSSFHLRALLPSGGHGGRPPSNPRGGKRPSALAAGAAALALLTPALACGPAGDGASRGGSGEGAGDPDALPGRVLFPDVGSFTGLPERPEGTANSGFWDRWGDGRAEMSGYRITLPRYGEERDGTLVLVYVTEPHDRRRWIKDDDAPEPHRVNVMKLNAALTFQTGIYPYSVLTSVFSPVDDWGRAERFQPAKVVLDAQEWCGSYRHQLWPGPAGLRSLRLSYFASEGERLREMEVPEGTLYEDGLLIQLRELDGPFAGGGDWEGWIVPGLWRMRAGHGKVEPVRATITRDSATWEDTPTTRFVLEYGDYRRTFHVERAEPRRVLAWTTSEGTRAALIRTERLAYWRLNAEGDEELLERLGLDPAATGSPSYGAPCPDPGDATP